MFDQLIAKPAVVATQAKAKAHAKTAAPKVKAGAKTVRAATPAVKNPIKFAIAMGTGRPQRGTALKAHTLAFLETTGMLNMAKGTTGHFPKALATKIIGATAVAYHLAQDNFEQTDAGLTLTAKGIYTFGLYRDTDAEMVKAYAQFFKDGALNESIGIKSVHSVVKL